MVIAALIDLLIGNRIGMLTIIFTTALAKMKAALILSLSVRFHDALKNPLV
jgi:hypothetical protein